LARTVRNTWTKPIVAVTGSAGKTSTKDIISRLLEIRYKVGKTIGNLNNHIGLPLTLLRLPADSDLAVVEMGMNHAGEIRHLAEIARPQIGVITNVGYAHIEAFESIDGIAAAKRELIESLPPDGIAVLNADDKRVRNFGSHFSGKIVTYGASPDSDVRAENITTAPEATRFEVQGVAFQTALTGSHAVSNILAGMAVAQEFGIPLDALRQVVTELTPARMRGERKNLRGMTILNDSYNSNPEAARAMIDVLMSEPAKRKIAVLGEMLELGTWAESLHRDVGRYAALRGVDILIGVRGAAHWITEEAVSAGMNQQSTLFFEDAESAGVFLRKFSEPGDALLFKASRGTQIEKALARMEG
jgi:UDP-N-acetylmuramoyl-tripeptide--D-alanyl-D-alanine ligase